MSSFCHVSLIVRIKVKIKITPRIVSLDRLSQPIMEGFCSRSNFDFIFPNQKKKTKKIVKGDIVLV